MTPLLGSLGSTSPTICPLMRSYCPTAPKLLPPKVGDSVALITTCVTRACADGASHSTTPVSERQQTMVVFGDIALTMRASRGAGVLRSTILDHSRKHRAMKPPRSLLRPTGRLDDCMIGRRSR